jgi:hypothetical protein
MNKTNRPSPLMIIKTFPQSHNHPLKRIPSFDQLTAETLSSIRLLTAFITLIANTP